MTGHSKIKVPKRAWIGIDPSRLATAVACWKTFSGLKQVELSSEDVRRLRPDGTRCAVGLDMERLFFEYVKTPARSRSQARKLAPGLLDLRLPVAIEKCVHSQVADEHSRDALRSYVMSRSDLANEIQANRSEGCDGELYIPIAEALWQYLHTAAPAGANLSLALNCDPDGWLLLVGHGASLRSVIRLAAGDLDGLKRNLEILTARFELPIDSLQLTGPDSARFKVEIESIPSVLNKVKLPSPPTPLALILTQSAYGKARTADLRILADNHPAVERRAFRRAILQTAVFLLSGLLLLSASGFRQRQAAIGTQAMTDKLSQLTDRLAGRKLPVRGMAAVELARNEFEARLSPTIEAAGEVPLANTLVELLRIADLRQVVLHEITLDERRIGLRGYVANEADIAALREAGRRAQLLASFDSDWAGDDQITFHGTFVRGELP